MSGMKLRWILMITAILFGSFAMTPQTSEAGWGYAYRAPVRAYRYAYRPVVPYHRTVAPVVVPRAVYRPVAPVVAAPYYSGYRSYSPYYSGFGGYSPYTSGYRGISVNIGYGVAPVGYIGY